MDLRQFPADYFEEIGKEILQKDQTTLKIREQVGEVFLDFQASSSTEGIPL